MICWQVSNITLRSELIIFTIPDSAVARSIDTTRTFILTTISTKVGVVLIVTIPVWLTSGIAIITIVVHLLNLSLPLLYLYFLI
jgi:hypothetical protein